MIERRCGTKKFELAPSSTTVVLVRSVLLRYFVTASRAFRGNDGGFFFLSFGSDRLAPGLVFLVCGVGWYSTLPFQYPRGFWLAGRLALLLPPEGGQSKRRESKERGRQSC